MSSNYSNTPPPSTVVSPADAMLNIIVAAREEAGLTQQQLAQRLGVHRNTIQQREAGQKAINLTQVQQHLSACGVSTRWLASALVSSVGTERSEGGDEKIADAWEAYRRDLQRQRAKAKPSTGTTRTTDTNEVTP